MVMTRFAYLFLFAMLLSLSYAAITPTSSLSVGQTLSSPNEIYELGFFSPNNSQNLYVGIWFKGITPRVVLWVANRENPVTDSTANLAITSNGTLILFNGQHDPLWSIGETFASNGSRAELSDIGNLVVIDKVSGRTLWQSFEHLGDTMLPLSTLIYNLATGEKRVLTSWKSDTDPSPGDFVVQISPQVPSQAFTMRDSTPYWRSGPWAKTRFTGIPEMDETYTSPFSLQQDANGSGSFTFLHRNFKLPRIVITSEGSLKIPLYNGTEWELYFEAPVNLCDHYGVCGPFGLCVMSKCKCFKGFIPKYSEEWRRGNWTGGCVRRTELLCQGNSTSEDANVFHAVANVKPPDFYEFAATSETAEDCYQSCVHNCSCLAFAYIHGIGCLVWNQELMDAVQFSARGELISIRLARSEMGGNKRKKTITASIVSLSLFVILGSAGFCFWRYRVKHNANISKDASQDAWRNDLTPQDFSSLCFFEMNTIETATNYFSHSNKLGQGGFGSVFKGKLQDGKEIAVKRLSSSSDKIGVIMSQQNEDVSSPPLLGQELACEKWKVHVIDDDGKITEENISGKQVWSMKNRRVMVDYNRRGQPIKDSGGLLGSWLGSLSYDLNILPVNYTDWRKIAAYRKDMAWKVIQEEQSGVEPSRSEIFIASRTRSDGTMICEEENICAVSSLLSKFCVWKVDVSCVWKVDVSSGSYGKV
ncbi:unnamed protein product [Microthlaspi erraticum]|uniref:Receptor-like serine/threonine-protein kinase n=1 Tax=Microthlaspi erraticum TaxID=1685480 RepID=A0A6D2I8B7_9BRAS|nr:unnamed protein product [Microthlaspi erraticum]